MRFVSDETKLVGFRNCSYQSFFESPPPKPHAVSPASVCMRRFAKKKTTGKNRKREKSLTKHIFPLHDFN